MNTALLLMTFLSLKHLIIDFPLQPRYQYSNKGKYGHFGGLLHSFLHGVGTIICLFAFAPLTLVALLGILDAVLHYHIDWAKVNINAKMGWGPTTHEEFWWLLGVDQFFHMMTYVLLIWMVV
jgi:hypothetical protein